MVLANKLGAFKERLHGLLLCKVALSLQCGKELSQLLASLTHDVGVPHNQSPKSVHLEAFLINEEPFKGCNTVTISALLPQEDDFGVVAHDELDFFEKEPIFIDKFLLCRDDVTIEIECEYRLRKTAHLQTRVPLLQLSSDRGVMELSWSSGLQVKGRRDNLLRD